VLPQARRFSELGVTADAPLPELEPIVQLARSPGGPSAAAASEEQTPDGAQPAGTGASNARQA